MIDCRLSNPEWVELALCQPWGGPPGASPRKAHAACSAGCVPGLMRMIHGASDCPIANDGAWQRVLVGGLGPAPAVPVGRHARRFHTLIGLGPGHGTILRGSARP